MFRHDDRELKWLCLEIEFIFTAVLRLLLSKMVRFGTLRLCDLLQLGTTIIISRKILQGRASMHDWTKNFIIFFLANSNAWSSKWCLSYNCKVSVLGICMSGYLWFISTFDTEMELFEPKKKFTTKLDLSGRRWYLHFDERKDLHDTTYTLRAC